MSVTRATWGAVAVLALLGAANVPGAFGQKAVAQSKFLWATVNVCDTAGNPNTLGIRASMPGGGGRAERMFMRFQVQYYRPSNDSWHRLGPEADSGFVLVGSGKFKARQSGRNFVLEPPPSGASHVVRGVVTYEWRRDGEVVRRARKFTRAGRPDTVGADPPGFSAATCEIR